MEVREVGEEEKCMQLQYFMTSKHPCGESRVILCTEYI